MGFSPRAVGALSLYQFAAAVDGWNRAHTSETTLEPPSAAEYEAAVKAFEGK